MSKKKRKKKLVSMCTTETCPVKRAALFYFCAWCFYKNKSVFLELNYQ